MERMAGAVERFACGLGGRVEMSKCRVVLGTAFAGVGRSWVRTGRTGRGCVGWVCTSGRLRKRSEAKSSACRVGCGSWLCGTASLGLHLRPDIALNCMRLHLLCNRTLTEKPDKIAEKRRILVLFGEKSQVKMVIKRYALKKCVEMQNFDTLKT